VEPGCVWQPLMQRAECPVIITPVLSATDVVANPVVF